MAPLKGMVSQRWNVLFATTAIEMSRRRVRVRARSPRVLPMFLHTMELLPHSRSTIVGVRDFSASTRSEKRARIHANSCLSPSLLSLKTAVRLVRQT